MAARHITELTILLSQKPYLRFVFTTIGPIAPINRIPTPRLGNAALSVTIWFLFNNHLR